MQSAIQEVTEGKGPEENGGTSSKPENGHTPGACGCKHPSKMTPKQTLSEIQRTHHQEDPTSSSQKTLEEVLPVYHRRRGGEPVTHSQTPVWPPVCLRAAEATWSGVQAHPTPGCGRGGGSGMTHTCGLGIGPCLTLISAAPFPDPSAPGALDTHGHHGTCPWPSHWPPAAVLRAGHRGMQVGPMLRAFPGQRGASAHLPHRACPTGCEAAIWLLSRAGCPEPIVFVSAAATACGHTHVDTARFTDGDPCSLSCGLQLEAVNTQ